MPFSAKANDLVTRMCHRADKEAGASLGMTGDELAELYRKMDSSGPGMQGIVDACDDKSTVPPELAAEGVTQESWDKAVACKAMAAKYRQASAPGGFHPKAVKRMAAEVGNAKHLKTKACKPTAIAALQTADKESAEDLARAIHDSESQ